MRYLLLVSLTYVVTLESWDKQCDLPGLCDGTVLTANMAENKADCVKNCWQTPGCSWYSLDTSTNICLALEDCPQLDERMTNTTSGQRECSEITCDQSGLCQGVLVSASPSTSPNSCLLLCQLNPRCFWFTFLGMDEICLQLEDCPTLQPCWDCTSGQKACQAKVTNNIMIGANGYELLDFRNSSAPNCKLPLYPSPIEEPALMVYDEVDNVVRACGGKIPGTSPSNFNITTRCFTFDGSEWEDMEETAAEYYYLDGPGSVTVPGVGWWVYSCWITYPFGCVEDEPIFSEIFLSNHTWVPGPELPRYNNSMQYNFPADHCTVQLNSSHTMITGGLMGKGTLTTVWLYDWTRQQWTLGPSLSTARSKHTCITMDDGRVMVAGGIDYNNQDHITTEIFSLSVGGWSQGIDLPEVGDHFRSQMFNLNGDLLWINDMSSWRLEDDKWSRLKVSPSILWWKFAVNVPDDFVLDC